MFEQFHGHKKDQKGPKRLRCRTWIPASFYAFLHPNASTEALLSTLVVQSHGEPPPSCGLGLGACGAESPRGAGRTSGEGMGEGGQAGDEWIPHSAAGPCVPLPFPGKEKSHFQHLLATQSTSHREWVGQVAVRVPTVSYASLMRRYGVTRLHLLKIDTEGAGHGPIDLGPFPARAKCV